MVAARVRAAVRRENDGDGLMGLLGGSLYGVVEGGWCLHAGGYVLNTLGRVAHGCTHIKAFVHRCGGQHRAAIRARMKGWGRQRRAHRRLCLETEAILCVAP